MRIVSLHVHETHKFMLDAKLELGKLEVLQKGRQELQKHQQVDEWQMRVDRSMPKGDISQMLGSRNVA